MIMEYLKSPALIRIDHALLSMERKLLNFMIIDILLNIELQKDAKNLSDYEIESSISLMNYRLKQVNVPAAKTASVICEKLIKKNIQYKSLVTNLYMPVFSKLELQDDSILFSLDPSLNNLIKPKNCFPIDYKDIAKTKNKNALALLEFFLYELSYTEGNKRKIKLKNNQTFLFKKSITEVKVLFGIINYSDYSIGELNRSVLLLAMKEVNKLGYIEIKHSTEVTRKVGTGFFFEVTVLKARRLNDNFGL